MQYSQACIHNPILNGDFFTNIKFDDIEGEFEKDDIVKIFDHNAHLLGVGKVQHDSVKARELIGKKNQKPLVHCDYLYLE